MKNNCTISVKSLIVALVMISGSSAAFAQHHRPKENPFKSYENSYLTNRFFDNWYIGVGAGGQVFEGQDNSRGAFRKRITSAFEVYLGKWFTPAVGMRFKMYGTRPHGFSYSNSPYIYGMPDRNGLYREKFNMWNLHGDFMVNFSAAVFGYKENRVYEILPYIGIGFAHAWYKSAPTRNDMTANFGIVQKFCVSPAIDINLEVSQMLVNDAFDGVDENGIIDGSSVISVGITYKFKKRGFDRGIPAAVAFDALLAQQADYDAQISQYVAERDAALAAAAVAAEQAAIAESTEPDTVTRTVVRAQPLAVFFTIGQTNITDKEMVNLKYAAQVIKDSPGHVYKITGYADTQTGTPQRNEYLSNQRAQNVYDALVNKFGVSPKSLKIVPRKGQSVPFDNAVLDRVSIVESSSVRSFGKRLSGFRTTAFLRAVGKPGFLRRARCFAVRVLRSVLPVDRHKACRHDDEYPFEGKQFDIVILIQHSVRRHERYEKRYSSIKVMEFHTKVPSVIYVAPILVAPILIGSGMQIDLPDTSENSRMSPSAGTREISVFSSDISKSPRSIQSG